MQAKNDARLAALFVFIGGASYGVVSPLVKYVYQKGFGVTDLSVAQFYYAAITFWLLALVTYRKGRGRYVLTQKTWVRLAGLGILSALATVAYYEALRTLPVWLGVILMFQYTWMTFLIQFAITRKLPFKWEWWSVALIIAGTVFANLGGARHTGHVTWVGIVLGIVAAIGYSLFIYGNAGIDATVPPFYRSAVMATVSAVVITLVFPPHGAFWSLNLHGMWVDGFLVGIFNQVLPIFAFAVGIPRVGGGAAAILASVELPVALALSAWWLGEPVGGFGWSGAAVIMAGIAVGQIRAD